MKLLTVSKRNNFFNFYNKPLVQSCVRFLTSLWRWLSLGLSPREQVVFRSIQRMKRSEKLTSENLKSTKPSKIISSLRALVDRAAAVFNSKAVTKAFPRIILGVTLLVIVGPQADIFYTRFDVNDRVPSSEWYYESWNWFWLCTGPYIKSIITTLGYYFCLIHKRTILSYVFVYSLFYDIGKIIWLIQVDTHAEYESVTPDMFLIYGAVTSVFLIAILNLLSFWLFHRVHAVRASLEGLYSIADKMKPEQVGEAFIKTMDRNQKVKQFNY